MVPVEAGRRVVIVLRSEGPAEGYVVALAEPPRLGVVVSIAAVAVGLLGVASVLARSAPLVRP